MIRIKAKVPHIGNLIESEVRVMEKLFNSIHIDLSKRIFELNGEPMKMMNGLELSCEGSHWFLRVSKDELYVGTSGQKVRE